MAEELRITVGNDQYRDSSQGGTGDRRQLGLDERLGSSSGHYEPDYSSSYRYGKEQTDRYGSSSQLENKTATTTNPFRSGAQEGSGRGYIRDGGDRRGIGASDQDPYRASLSRPLFAAASRLADPDQTGSPYRSTNQSSTARPLKSILKKKNDPGETAIAAPSQKTTGLPGMSNYIDEIDDEEKFLYGDEDTKTGDKSGGYGFNAEGSSAGPDIRSAAQAWKPSAPSNTVSGIVSQFASSQSQELRSHQSQSVGQHSQLTNTSSNAGGGNDLWSMLAKSVQTVQKQQQQIQPQQPVYSASQHPSQQTLYSAPQQQQQLSYSQQNQQSTQPVQAPQPKSTDTGHDPTIENILKSIGFDFDMSKRMQEKAKQASGEVVAPKPAVTEASQFGINHSASFIGSGMSHEDMRSSLGGNKSDAGSRTVRQESHEKEMYNRGSRDRPYDDRERSREYDDRDKRSQEYGDKERRNQEYDNRDRRSQEYDNRRGESIERKQRDYDDDWRNSVEKQPRRSFDDNKESSFDRRKSSYDHFTSPPQGQNQNLPERGLSPVSDEGSPPPPMFNLPPITIKRRSVLERNRSPGWDRKRSPEITVRVGRSSRSPSFTRSVSSHGRRSNRSMSPDKERPRKSSPVIRRTITIDPEIRKRLSPGAKDYRGESPAMKRKSPVVRRRSRSPRDQRRSSRSPGRRSPGRRHSRSPGKRRSPQRGRSRTPSRGRSPGRRHSPGRRRSRSPRRKSRSPRHRSPRRRSLSPGRGRSPVRRSISPRGRKRGFSPRSTSRDRKIRRGSSRDRQPRSRSIGRRSRSSSIGQDRRRRSFSSGSDSDVDGPANKQYFSSPLRLAGRPPKRVYDEPPLSQPLLGPPGPPGPLPDYGVPVPPPGYGPGPMAVGPPPFGLGPPPFSVPPPMQPAGPIQYPSQLTYVVPTVPHIVDTSQPPPGPFEILPNQVPDMPDVPGEERKVFFNREQVGESINRTVLPPKSTGRGVGSDSSHERIVVVGGKAKSIKKFDSGKTASVLVDPIKEKARILKEKEDLDKKINLLQSEFNNLKKLEEDLKSKTKDIKANENILEENSKLREEIKRELGKLVKERKAFETKHEGMLQDVLKREGKITSKKTESEKKTEITKKEKTPSKTNEKSVKKEPTRQDSQVFYLLPHHTVLLFPERL